ncbi:selenocysteine-specific translation elongation factor [Ammonifex degensii KC4]|uniref:Selenocysteine-specific elongation factor n=1 Tax=Ammonifex degensii (strain DSM 10501 / KC4) TaxID=429009 RepID=C9RC43_AMMDK|nr:selenocysteine-specific translation elongation factor [Ammonifex degensii]ACX51820.1 selenocysteine-specific translation elongation factor [Ammonifex degensii KC4]
MKRVIIGTAGHVDHGKTALIKALTGIDTDRLKEEKERGISIELGFAYLDLPSGIRAGIVDVPGHERLVRTMLAGAHGIDLVLLVVAADEGVMPQTREHVDIIGLLGIGRGVVALTKIDLVEPDWLELVQEEVKEYLTGTSLRDAPIVPVSAVTGEGLAELVRVLDALAQEVTEKPATGPVRLPLDRVFTVAGFGTVVTGTLVSGTIRVGDTLSILPPGKTVRVRQLQVHKQRVEEARAGQRVAANLVGVEAGEIERGNVLVTPGAYSAVTLLDAKLYLLPNARPLKHRAKVRFHLGTTEVSAQLHLLDREELAPGEEALLQLLLEEPVVAAKEDRFVIRSFSPPLTVGGGRVLALPRMKYKRFRPEVLQYLGRLAEGELKDQVEAYLHKENRPVSLGTIAEALTEEKERVIQVLEELSNEEKVKLIKVEGQVYACAATAYRQLREKACSLVARYLEEYPLREGMPKEELRSRLLPQFGVRAFQALLEEWAGEGALSLTAQAVSLPGQAHPSAEDQERIASLEEVYRRGGLQPPSLREAASLIGVEEKRAEEYQGYLLRSGRLVKVAEGIIFHQEVLAAAEAQVVAALKERGEITVAEVRDLLSTSRKYVVPLLEYLDGKRVTRRVGDKRVLVKKG